MSIPTMGDDESYALVNARYAAGRRVTHFVMSRETAISFARACAVDLPDDWQPPPGRATELTGVPIIFNEEMPLGAWRLVDVTTDVLHSS